MRTGLNTIRLKFFSGRDKGIIIIIVSAAVFAALVLPALFSGTGAAGGPGGGGGAGWQELALTLIAGAALSLAGALYQTALKNPIAVPTILGVDSGVSLAQTLLAAALGSQVMSASGVYYAASYAAAFAVLALILLCGKASGGKRMSVVDMVLAGVVINIMLQVLTNNVQGSMGESEQLSFDSAAQGASAASGAGSISGLLGLAVVCAAVMVPVFAMRFSMNAVSFDDGDGRCLGVCAGRMRVWALVAGTVLTAAAAVHYGTMGVLSLLVPHLCRYIFGADTRRVFAASAFYGALLMLAGWYLSNASFIGTYQVSVETILDMISLPLLLIFVARMKHGWE